MGLEDVQRPYNRSEVGDAESEALRLALEARRSEAKARETESQRATTYSNSGGHSPSSVTAEPGRSSNLDHHLAHKMGDLSFDSVGMGRSEPSSNLLVGDKMTSEDVQPLPTSPPYGYVSAIGVTHGTPEGMILPYTPPYSPKVQQSSSARPPVHRQSADEYLQLEINTRIPNQEIAQYRELFRPN
jgi:hypothetical protein